jgi:hypothetical protein
MRVSLCAVVAAVILVSGQIAISQGSVIAPAFSYLPPIEGGNEGLVTLTFASWNLISGLLVRLDGLRRAA